MCAGPQKSGHPHQDRVRERHLTIRNSKDVNKAKGLDKGGQEGSRAGKDIELPLLNSVSNVNMLISVFAPSRRRVPKEPPTGGAPGEYMPMDDYGDDDEVPGLCFPIVVCLI